MDDICNHKNVTIEEDSELGLEYRRQEFKRKRSVDDRSHRGATGVLDDW